MEAHGKEANHDTKDVERAKSQERANEKVAKGLRRFAYRRPPSGLSVMPQRTLAPRAGDRRWPMDQGSRIIVWKIPDEAR